jgi:2,4'-dihydroxyacetophenone dioxygenase
MNSPILTPPERAMIQLPPEPHAAIITEFGLNGDHIGPSEAESPWVPFGDSAAIRHLSFDVRTGAVANILWVKGGGRIGTHRHRGAVSAITLEGTWGYYEYDWVAKPGSFVYETPGTAHTLYSDDPNGMKAMFWINGAIEFFDDAGKLTDTFDVFWFINHYVSYCREKGLPINKSLFL